MTPAKELIVVEDTMMVCTLLRRAGTTDFVLDVQIAPTVWTTPFASPTLGTTVPGATPTVTAVEWPTPGNRKTSGGFTVTIHGTNLSGTPARTVPPVLRFGDWPCFGPFMYSHTGPGGLISGEVYTGPGLMMTCVMGPGIGTGLPLKFNFKWSSFNAASPTYWKVASPRKVLFADVDLTVQVISQPPLRYINICVCVCVCMFLL